MSKFKPYSRRELKRRRIAWVKSNAKVVALVVGGMAGLIAFLTVLLVVAWLDNNARTYVIGAAHADIVAATLHLLNSAFLAHDREAIWHVRGAWGEENTRDELQRAKRKGLIWAERKSCS